ncbi:MAG: hypothetical protein AABZ39_10930 [Spirochaetota bacterium]
MIEFAVIQREIRKRRFTLAEIIITSWHIFRRYFRVLFICAICISLPLSVARFLAKPYLVPVNNAIAAWAERSIDTAKAADPVMHEKLRKSVRAAAEGIDITAFIATFFSIISGMAALFIVNETLNGGKASVRGALVKALRRWPFALGALVVFYIAVFAGLICFIIPGIILYINFAFAIEAATLRNVSLVRALTYSRSLVRGHWLDVFAFTIFLMMTGTLISLLVLTPFMTAPDNLISAAASTALIDVFSQFVSVASGIYFLNLDFTRERYA